MLRRIEIVNFMSHVQTTIELGAGLTVLTGPNNCGKSAVVGALQALCDNARGDFMVRHGQKECRVLVETDDGHVIEWKRRGDSVSYTIDGQDVHRVGGAVPDNLHELLRLPKVQSPEGKDSFEIHFAEQKSPLFLLDEGGRKSAMFFASSSDAALLMEMQRRHKARQIERRSEEKRLSGSVERFKRRLAALEPVEAIQQRVGEAEQAHDELQRASAHHAAMETHLAALDRQGNEAERLRNRCESLAALQAPPEQADTRLIEHLVRDLPRAELSAKHECEARGALESLVGPPDLADTTPLTDLCQSLERQTSRIVVGEQRTESLARLPAPPLLDDVAGLEQLCDALAHQGRQFDAAKRRAGWLDPVQAPPVLAELRALAELVGQFAAADDATRAASARLAQAGADVLVVRQELRHWAQAHPTCPLCGADIDPDRLIERGGAHAHQ